MPHGLTRRTRPGDLALTAALLAVYVGARTALPLLAAARIALLR